MALVSNTVFDLAVIGAGPAGSAAAITAAGRRIRILHLEAGQFPRQKVCGEFISAEAVGLLKSLLLPEDLSALNTATEISEARLYVDGRCARLPVKPAAINVPRSDLDSLLWKSAQQHGAVCQEKCRVKAITKDGNLFQVSTEADQFLARTVVNCSGRWSELRMPIEQPISRPEKWIGIKGHFYESNPSSSCDLYFFGDGYCGVLPIKPGKEGIVNAAAMVRSDRAKNFEEIFPLQLALQQRMRSWRPVFPPVTTSPLIFNLPQTSYNDVLLAGDAAGFIDPFTGDGISLAIHSGIKAASTMHEYLARGLPLQHAIEAYDGWYRSNLLPAFSAAKRLRYLLDMPRFVRRFSMSLLNIPLVGSAAVGLTRARGSLPG